MVKLIAIILILISPIAFSAETTTSQMVYYKTVIGIFFNVVLLISFLMGLIGLGWMSWVGLKTALNPTLAQQDGRKPITIFKYMAGMVVVTLFFFPFNGMKLFNDISGLESQRPMCLVVDVTVEHIDWANDASGCISYVEEQLSSVAEYSNNDHIKSANLGVLFGVIQLVSLSFFVGSLWMLVLHIIGVREVKMTVWQSILAMFFSSVLMALPNATTYIKDFKERQNDVINIEK